MKARILFALALSLVPHFVLAQTNLTCVFERPLIFGASISGGYDAASPVPALLAQRRGRLFHGKNLDPVTRLAQLSGGTVTNISEILNIMPDMGYGHRQFVRYVDSSLDMAQNATLLAGIDAFYWPAIHGRCEEALDGAEYLINFAREHNQALILGNVPAEDPTLVDPLLKSAGGWRAPDVQCREAINSFLAQNCLSHNQCYVIDLFSAIQKLNSPAGISFEGETNHTKDFRFDGIHLTPKGTRFLMGLVERALQANPPACAKARP